MRWPWSKKAPPADPIAEAIEKGMVVGEPLPSLESGFILYDLWRREPVKMAFVRDHCVRWVGDSKELGDILLSHMEPPAGLEPTPVTAPPA